MAPNGPYPRARLAAAGGALLGLLMLLLLLPSRSPRSAPATAPAPRDLTVATKPAARRTPPARPADRPAAPTRPTPSTAQAPADTGTDDAEPLRLFVDVVDSDGRPTERAVVIPIDCAGFGRAGDHYLALPGTCVLRAGRMDGLLRSAGPVSTIEVREHDQYEMLSLGSERRGGIGIRFGRDARGMRVLNVLPDTPAARAGLEPGDLVVAVDGLETHEMNLEGFVDEMTGPEGTVVVFTIGYVEDGEWVEETLEVERSFLQG